MGETKKNNEENEIEVKEFIYRGISKPEKELSDVNFEDLYSDDYNNIIKRLAADQLTKEIDDSIINPKSEKDIEKMKDDLIKMKKQYRKKKFKILKKKTTSFVKRLVRNIFHYIIPTLFYLTSYIIPVIIDFKLFYIDGYFKITNIIVFTVPAIIFLLIIATKVTKLWLKILEDNNIIK